MDILPWSSDIAYRLYIGYMRIKWKRNNGTKGTDLEIESNIIISRIANHWNFGNYVAIIVISIGFVINLIYNEISMPLKTNTESFMVIFVCLLEMINMYSC